MAIADDVDGGGVPAAADEDVPIAHARLRSALELAVGVLAEARRRRLPVPDALRPFLGSDRLPAAALGKVRRVLTTSPELRARIGSVAADGGIDELGVVWLTRPEGWAAQVLLLDRLAAERERRERAEADVRRERKRREAAEDKRDRAAADDRSRSELISSLNADLAAAREAATTAASTIESLRAQLAESRTAARHAADRQLAAEQRRDELEARLAGSGQADGEHEPPAAPEPMLDVNELRRAVARLHDVATDIAALVETPTDTAGAHVRRTPIVLPGSVLGRPAAAAERLLRSDADVLIDGYNAAKLGWPALSLAEQRRRLLDLVDNVIRRFGTSATVVFDGSDVVGASSEQGRLVRVMFSPAGVIADDMIIERVRRLPAGRHVVVVTDDGELRRRAAGLGANLVRSQALLDVGLG